MYLDLAMIELKKYSRSGKQQSLTYYEQHWFAVK
jgi:hypothetical protein